MKRLTEEELNALRDLKHKLDDKYREIGIFQEEVNKSLETVKAYRKSFLELEQALIEKYGKNVSINLKTGAVSEHSEADDRS